MTKYELRITGECKQNLKICKKRGLPMQELWDVVAITNHRPPDLWNRNSAITVLTFRCCVSFASVRVRRCLTARQ